MDAIITPQIPSRVFMEASITRFQAVRPVALEGGKLEPNGIGDIRIPRPVISVN
jgi:hypothetical protein